MCGIYSTHTKKTRHELGTIGAKYHEKTLLVSRICRLMDKI